MQITIEIPDWMAADYEARTGSKFDNETVEIAARAYYASQFDPTYNRDLTEKTLVALYGVG